MTGKTLDGLNTAKEIRDAKGSFLERYGKSVRKYHMDMAVGISRIGLEYALAVRLQARGNRVPSSSDIGAALGNLPTVYKGITVGTEYVGRIQPQK